MSTGYKIADGRDLSDIFQSGSTSITTYYETADGTDLGQLFMGGNSGYITNYETADGTDLGQIFERKLPFTVTGAQIYGTTAQDPSGFRYCYAIFTDTSNSYKSATVQQDFTSISITCVGGGGGGGGSSDQSAAGGGGGGAVQKVDLIEIPTGTVYEIIVGAGGAGGDYTINSGAGGNGLISAYGTPEVQLGCFGGTGGNNNAAGSGGLYVPGYISTGSNGGRAAAGQNCTYTNPMGDQYLDFPAILKNTQPIYICELYAGGGGGTKTSSKDTSYSGGGGGQAPGGISNGFGGVRGAGNQAGSIGQDGQGWGSGGGAGGFTARDDNFNGGAGKQGIVIVYSPIQ
jgi:hypothetical protein